MSQIAAICFFFSLKHSPILDTRRESEDLGSEPRKRDQNKRPRKQRALAGLRRHKCETGSVRIMMEKEKKIPKP